METKRKNYNTTLRADLIKKLKILAAEKDVRANDLLEEAIELLLRKYEKRAKNKAKQRGSMNPEPYSSPPH